MLAEREGGSGSKEEQASTRRRHGHGDSVEHCRDRDDGHFAKNPLGPFFLFCFSFEFENSTFLEFI